MRTPSVSQKLLPLLLSTSSSKIMPLVCLERREANGVGLLTHDFHAQSTHISKLSDTLSTEMSE